jgi:hypothetical protein
MTHPEKWTFGWFYSRLKPHKGDVYRPGQVLPEPDYETATGRKLYTVQQIRAAYAQGAKDSRTLLTRCRNMLSHPAHWGADDDVIKARHALYTEVLEHLNGLENCESWTERERRVVSAPKPLTDDQIDALAMCQVPDD